VSNKVYYYPGLFHIRFAMAAREVLPVLIMCFYVVMMLLGNPRTRIDITCPNPDGNLIY
jgi:hypothetical protein